MSGPLSGFKILDLSSVLSGPIATMLLADQGAEVTKVEPLHGEIMRHMGVASESLTAGFLSVNRGKRSIAIDLKTQPGLELVKRLARDADVFVQNFRPGAIERMGLGEDVIRAERENILYVSISGFGDKGPYVHKRVYDPVIQALSGIADIQADDAQARPKMMRTLIPDKTTGLTVAQAITAGLLSRERTGEGQHIRIAMLDAVISFLWPEGLGGLTIVGNEQNVTTGQLAQDLIFKTKNGYITTGALTDKEWQGMCAALEQPDWLEDPRFLTPLDRVKNMKIRLEETGSVLESRTSEEWLERLDAEQVPCAPVLTRPQVIEHEQVISNELVFEYDQPGLGRVRQPRAAARFEKTPTNLRQLAPRLGQHNREILTASGLSDEEIDALEASGVVGGYSE